jgi:4a-hydroxytetrahydrobiopterin dehydratase
MPIEQAREMMEQVPGWELVEEEKKLTRRFRFKSFPASIAFVNKLAEVAEAEGHHPDIHIFWNRVRLDLTTHAIKGLSENDFIMAAKINEIPPAE